MVQDDNHLMKKARLLLRKPLRNQKESYDLNAENQLTINDLLKFYDKPYILINFQYKNGRSPGLKYN